VMELSRTVSLLLADRRIAGCIRGWERGRMSPAQGEINPALARCTHRLTHISSAMTAPARTIRGEARFHPHSLEARDINNSLSRKN